jgi:hypothetical protein
MRSERQQQSDGHSVALAAEWPWNRQQLEARDAAKIKVRAQKQPLEWKGATAKLFLMRGFVEGMSARLAEEIERMGCEDIVL